MPETMQCEQSVRTRYAAAAKQREAALCCPVEYPAELLEAIPDEILQRDYGCGDPSPFLRSGDTVLDLGSGGGKLCSIAAQLVGAEGHVIDRCNLTILLAKGYEYLPDFLATHQVEIVASLPCYLEENADAQRGDGSFAKSVEALRELNHLGYGIEGSGLTLTLVYNPVGPSLPPNQEKLEATYRGELEARYDIRFNQLFTITNMPISRYLEHLVATSQFEKYMQILVEAFNPAALSGLMCRSTLSVGWDGRLFDCDFNQMLDMEVGEGYPSTIDMFAHDSLCHREIVTSQHCFGCTAGAGSGCQGAISN